MNVTTWCAVNGSIFLLAFGVAGLVMGFPSCAYYACAFAGVSGLITSL